MTEEFPRRLVYDMTGGATGRCAAGVVFDYGDQVPRFRHVVMRCRERTHGLTVHVPLAGSSDEVVTVEVCSRHAQRLWELHGKPRGEPPWLDDDEGTVIRLNG